MRGATHGQIFPGRMMMKHRDGNECTVTVVKMATVPDIETKAVAGHRTLGV